MEEQFGPTEGQVRALRELGFDPGKYSGYRVRDIGSVISLARKQARDRKKCEARLSLIRGMDLRVGQVVPVRISNVVAERTIRSITEDGFILFEGIARASGPQAIAIQKGSSS